MNPYVGQTLILTNPYGCRGQHEATVTKVGRKYFYADDRKFEIETACEVIARGYLGGVAFTPDEWAEVERVGALRSKLAEFGVVRPASGSVFGRATSAQLQQIVDVMQGGESK